MIVSYTLSLFSKENALAFILVLLMYHYVFEEKFNITQFLPIVTVTIIYLILRTVILKSENLNIALLPSAFIRLPGFFVAATNYLRLLFLPYGLHFDYGNKVFGFLDPKAITGAILLLLLIIYAIIKKKKDAIVSFAIFWFIIMLIPNSGIYPITAFYMAEHYLYLSLIGFSFILSKYLVWLYSVKASKAAVAFIVSALIIFYGYLTIRQNHYWIEPIDFYLTTLSFTPDSVEIYYNLASEYDRINNKGMALALYKKAINLDPGFDKAYNSLGIIYSNLNRKNEALMLFRKALDLNPQSANAYNNLGILYYELGKNDDSFAFFKKAFEINPDYPVVLYNLAVAHYYRKEYGLASEYCDKAMKLGYKVNADFMELLKSIRK
jgi:tetratricopeptide (TPR) repeat protein